jgi:hypothetical protein
MLDLFHIAKPQNCDIQIFYGDGSTGGATVRSWVKPRGVSNVYILLIGGGGNGNGTSGGGSGSVTVWYGSALNAPDILVASPSPGNNGADTILQPFFNASTIIRAQSASGPTAGPATTANFFAASGFYQSIAGANGTGGSPGASSTTFLQGGGTAAAQNSSNYGYSADASGTNRTGFLLLQPIIVGMGGMGAGAGGIGCGGGSNAGVGGPGMVLIASW